MELFVICLLNISDSAIRAKPSPFFMQKQILFPAASCVNTLRYEDFL